MPLSAAEKSSRWEVAARLLKEFRHTRQRPDSVTHNAELCSYGRGSKWQKAYSALWGLKSMTAQANAIGHNTALLASVEAKQWRSAIRNLDVFRRRAARMIITRVINTVTIYTYNYLLYNPN